MSTDLARLGFDATFPPDDLREFVARPFHGGVQVLWSFPNQRGASVINHAGSYGTELAVLRRTGEAWDAFELDYSTPITGDVIGHIDSPAELVDLLRQIRDLPGPSDPDVGHTDGSGQDIFDAIESLGRMSGL